MKIGIDVSHHNPLASLDWPQLVRDGVEYCFVRACYGVRSDKLFPEHIKAARAAGVLVGAYLFYRQSQGRQEQLDAFVAEMDRAGIGAGDICPVVDLEWNTAYDGAVVAKKFNEDARWIVEQLAAKYGRCICYYAPGFFQLLGSPTWLLSHPWWLCHYTSKAEPWEPAGAPQWAIWQHRGGTFYKDGKVTLLGGRLPGYGKGQKDIDLNRAREIPLIGAYQAEPDHEIPLIDPDAPVTVPDTEPAPPPKETGPALSLARLVLSDTKRLVELLEEA